MAEGGGLLNRYTVNSRIVGSNPIPSAKPRFPTVSIRLKNDVFLGLSESLSALLVS